MCHARSAFAGLQPFGMVRVRNPQRVAPCVARGRNRVRGGPRLHRPLCRLSGRIHREGRRNVRRPETTDRGLDRSQASPVPEGAMDRRGFLVTSLKIAGLGLAAVILPSVLASDAQADPKCTAGDCKCHHCKTHVSTSCPNYLDCERDPLRCGGHLEIRINEALGPKGLGEAIAGHGTTVLISGEEIADRVPVVDEHLWLVHLPDGPYGSNAVTNRNQGIPARLLTWEALWCEIRLLQWRQVHEPEGTQAVRDDQPCHA